MTFDDAFNELKTIEVIQRELLELSEDSMDDTANLIANSKLDEKQIRGNVFWIGRVRSKNVSLYCRLLAKIAERSEKFSNLVDNFFTKRLLFLKKSPTDITKEDEPYKKDENSINRCFIRSLYDNSLISMDRIMKIMSLYCETDLQYVCLFESFMCELKERMEKREFLNKKDKVLYAEIGQYAKYTIITQENLLHEYISYGYPKNSIEYILKFDEADELPEKTTEPGFSWKKTTEESYFEPSVVPGGISYIQFAAFFGSVKSFKYILLNGVPAYDAMQYAIYGNNLEIVKICENANDLFTKELVFVAIKNFSNDIYSWLIDDKLEPTVVDEIFIDSYQTAVESLNVDIINRFLNDGFTISTDMLDNFRKLIGDKSLYLLSDKFDADLLKFSDPNQIDGEENIEEKDTSPFQLCLPSTK